MEVSCFFCNVYSCFVTFSIVGLCLPFNEIILFNLCIVIMCWIVSMEKSSIRKFSHFHILFWNYDDGLFNGFKSLNELFSRNILIKGNRLSFHAHVEIYVLHKCCWVQTFLQNFGSSCCQPTLEIPILPLQNILTRDERKSDLFSQVFWCLGNWDKGTEKEECIH